MPGSQDTPTTPGGFEGWVVEFGREGARKRGTVVATRGDAAEPWVWIQPALAQQYTAAPASRRPQAGADAGRVIVLVTQAQVSELGTWQEVDLGRPRFVSPKLGALMALHPPPGPRRAAGASRRRR